MKEDITGSALRDYHFNGKKEKIRIYSPDFDVDEIDVSWYFRTHDMMPEIEKTALKLCKGEILDMGAGAGCHSIVLQERGLEVYAADISEGACEVMKSRGVKKVWNKAVYDLPDKQFDTILMMMNGIGITGSMEGLEHFLDFLPRILKPGGQLVFDSSNLIYLFRDDDNFTRIDLAGRYYGEIDFQMEYNGIKGDVFQWLYIDFDNLSNLCEKRNYHLEFIKKGENLQYLARILF